MYVIKVDKQLPDQEILETWALVEDGLIMASEYNKDTFDKVVAYKKSIRKSIRLCDEHGNMIVICPFDNISEKIIKALTRSGAKELLEENRRLKEQLELTCLYNFFKGK